MICMYVLAFFADALRFSYMKERTCPYIYGRAKEGFSARLVPMVGYSSGITTSLWTGTHPSTHGNWFYWGYNNGGKSEKNPLFSLFRVFPKGKLRILAKSAFWYLLIKTGSATQAWFMPSLPDELLPYLSKYGSDFNPNTFRSTVPSLFDILRKNGVQYRWRESRSLRASQFRSIETKGNSCFDVISIPNLDGIGHDFGPYSSEIEREMAKIDNFVRQIVERYLLTIEDLHVVLFSDHGMAEITERVDIKGRIDRLHLKEAEHYLAFYDSTIARFWAFNGKAKDILLQALSKMPEGRILEPNELRREGVYFEDARYGQILFQMKNGAVIYPNYFVSVLPRWIKRGRGMHGYDGNERSNHGLFVYYGKYSKDFKPVQAASVVDILPTILDIMKLPIPRHSEGISLLRNRDH